MAVLSFKGGQIGYEVSGSGRTIVLLHGFLESRSIWKDISAHFSNKYKVVSIDLPGHGESSSFGYSHHMELMANAVKAVLKELNIRRCKVVGHSLGGYVAIALADQFPDSVSGICLFHSTVSEDSDQKKKERNKLIKLVQRDRDLFIREAIPNLFNTEHKPYKTAIKRHLAIARNTSLQGIIAALEGMKNRTDRQILLKFLPIPVFYIMGRYDNVLPLQKLLDECALSDRIQYEILDNTGHMGFVEEPEKTVNALERFLKLR